MARKRTQKCEVERLAFENILERKIQEVAGLERSISCFSFATCRTPLTGKWQTTAARRVSLKSTRLLQSSRSYVCFRTPSVNDAGHLEHWNRWSRFRALSRISRRRFIYNAAGHYATPRTQWHCAPSFSPPRAHTRIVRIGEEQSEMSVLHAAHRSLKSLGPCVSAIPVKISTFRPLLIRRAGFVDRRH